MVRDTFCITVPDDGNCIGYSWCILAAYYHIEIFRYDAVSANAELGHPKIGGGDVQHLRGKNNKFGYA